MKLTSRDRQGRGTVRLGLITNIFLAILKTTFGILGHSPALLADGINSTSDVAYYIVVMVFIRLARKPPDPEHPYGHRQLESIAAVVVGSFVITTAIAIFWNAVNDVYDLFMLSNDYQGAGISALWVALFTIVLKLVLTIYTRQVGEKTNNAAITALAYDHRNDVFSAAAAAIGIALGRAGYLWGDPLAGALVALVILKTGIEILRDSTSELMDTLPGRSLTGQIHQLLCDLPGVDQVEEIHAHRFGPYLVVNITIGVDGALTVAQGDAVASQVESTLYNNIEYMRRVHVHYHPVTKSKSPSILCE